LGLLKMKDNVQLRATTCLPGKALMIAIMGIVLGRHQAGEAVSHLFGNTCEQIGGSWLRMMPIVFGLDEPKRVAINGSQVDGFDVVPHPGEMMPIESPVIQLGDLPSIWKLKCQPIYSNALHQAE
jgi:hypothetical protein